MATQGTNVGQIYYECTLDTSKMVEGSRAARRELDGLGTRLTATAAAAAVLAAAFVAIKVAKLADEIRMLGARVDVAAGSVERGAAAFNELVAISRRTQSSLGGNIEVFNRLNQSILQMGGSQEDTLQTTELLGKAIKVSGASATEAKAAMLQFGQALGSGKLQGDELRSLMETAPYLMRQLADGIGVPVGALKKLGEEGKLTADVVMNALSKAAEKIDADFKKLPQTFESAMTVAQDQAALAALKFDELTGGSAALAGATKGLGDVFEELGKQFEGATTEADKLGRNSSVSNWADTTKIALSYLVDAVDLTWQSISVLGRNVKFVFESIGAEIGGLMAASMANAKRDWAGVRAIRQQMKEDSEKRRKELDEADAKTLGKAKLAGERMRQAWAAPQADYSNEGRLPTTTRGPLKSTATADTKGPKFDSAAYMAGLEKSAATGYERVDAIEREALRKNAELLKAGKITRQQAADAVLLIEETAARDRLEVSRAELAEVKKGIKNSSAEIADEVKKSAADRQKAVEYAAQLTRAVNPVDALRQEYEAKLELVTQYEQLMATAGIDATMQGEITRTEITRQYQMQRQALAEQSFRSQGEAQAFLMDSLNALSSSATSSIMGLINGTMSAQEAMRGLAMTVLNQAVGALVQLGVQQIKNALTAKTLEAADKARAAAKGAVYAASVTAQVAGMSALAAQNAFAATAAIPIIGPGLAPAAAAAAAAAAGAIGSPAIATAPLAGARQYGGPASAGSLYRVNETGRPEMFTASNGSQYMLPTKDGAVTAADQLGARVQVLVQVSNNHPTAQVSAQTDDSGRIVQIAVTEVANQISSNSGPVWSAMRGATNVQGRL